VSKLHSERGRLISGGLLSAILLHVLVLGWIWHDMQQRSVPAPKLMSVRLLVPAPLAAEPKPAPTPPKVQPMVPEPQPKPVVQRVKTPEPAPAPVVVDAKPAPQPRVIEVPPEPVVRPAPPAAPVPAPVSMEPPTRYDAQYLQNPRPRYPMMSNRLGEEGKVLLKVLVSAEGTVLELQLQRSSGFPRLDQSAMEAVRSWRFVPAKVGAQVISAWYVIPVNFNLTR